nr:PREDICTED: cadherin-related family member 3 [Lepisosteus oculatus]
MDHKTSLRVFIYLLLVFEAMQGVRGTISFAGLPSTANVAENSNSGTVVAQFQMTISGGASIAPKYPTIRNSNPLTKAFQVSMTGLNSGEVRITGNPILDFETAPNVFELPILAVDTTGDSNMQILTVYLTDVDEPPVFLDNLNNQDLLIYIPEGTPPGPLYEPNVVDPEGKPLTFSLKPENPAFSINPGNGFIASSQTFDYETGNKSYTFSMSVTDGTHTVVKTVIVYIVNTNDAKPQFKIKNTFFTIPEELPPGQVVANITAEDPDSFNYVGYLLYSLSPTQYFAINKYSGVITVAMRMDRDAQPLRDSPLVTVLVTARYSPPGVHTNSLTLTFNITDINDNPPDCNPAAQRQEVPETEVKGALIATVTCTDIDVDPANNQFKFTNLSCLRCNQMFAWSTKEPGNIVLTGSLDIEDPNNFYVGNEYSISVVAEDLGNPQMKGTAYIYVTTTPVNEYPPVFHPGLYVFNVSEIEGPSATVGVVNATDEDFPSIGITYSIAAGGSTLGLSNIFWIDPNKGIIKLLVRPDYEVKQRYDLLIEAVDGDPIKPLTSTATVIINIIEVNDEPPVCQPNGTTLIIPSDLRPGTNLRDFILTCTDLDSPPSSFRYAMKGVSNVNNHFVFSPTSGTNITRLILKEPFDYSGGLDKTWNYKLTVLIFDDNLLVGARQPKGLVGTGTIIINIQVVNPSLTTVSTTTPPSITYITKKENVYSSTAWYVPFIIALGSMILLGLLGYLLYQLGKYLSTKDCSCCVPRVNKYKESLIPETGNNAKKEVVMEMTKINTVFDGEAVDPVTGKVYEYNTKSGARRWKDTQIITKPQLKQPESSTLIIPVEPPSPITPKGRASTAKGQEASKPDEKEAENKIPLDPKGWHSRLTQRPAGRQSALKPQQKDPEKPILESGDLSEV